ncbi:MAG TPA: hypothetical protein VF065_16410 [Ilumatobacter sp.]
MRNLLLALTLSVIAVFGFAAVANADQTYPLVTNGGSLATAQNVGTVSVAPGDEPGTLTAIFKVDPALFGSDVGEFSLTGAAVAVGATAADIPNSKGNPVPGKFPYKVTGDHVDQLVVEGIPYNGGQVVLALHANVAEVSGMAFDLAKYNEYVATDGTLRWSWGDYTNAGSNYLDFHFTPFGGASVKIDGYCLNEHVYIYPDTTYQVDKYSTLDASSIPASVFPNIAAADIPLALARINFLMNNVDQVAGADWADLQAAMWTLVGDPATTGIGQHPAHVEALVLLAQQQILVPGDFVPDYGDQIGVVYAPSTASGAGQTLMAQLLIGGDMFSKPVYAGSTGWAAAAFAADQTSPLLNPFPGKNWATFVYYGAAA